MTHRHPPAMSRTRRALAVVAATLLLAAPACTRTSSTAARSGPATTSASSGTTTDVELFDTSVVHAISVDVDPDDYDDLLTAYAENGDKTWIEATVTIDGVTYERAGLRLKGNSTLRGLGRTATNPDAADEATSAGGPGIGSDTNPDEPETLPWRIRLDKFVDDQNHQGTTDLVIRSNSSTSALNEAVALDLLDAAGLDSLQAISTAFSMDGSDPVLRLAIELPDDEGWQDASFDGTGALYKADSSGDWSYRGDDPDDYEDVFTQKGGTDVTDLTPLMEFLDFVNNADDETFAAELGDHLDVAAFADYLAMMDLIGNSDDIAGPGNNAYLWWDEATGIMTVVPWDMNLAFGGFGMGGGGAPGGAPGGPGRPGGGPGGGFGRSNPLVERFEADADFEALYQASVERLRSELFTSGMAESFLDARVGVLADASGLIDTATLTDEADRVRSSITTTAGG